MVRQYSDLGINEWHFVGSVCYMIVGVDQYLLSMILK